MANTKSTQHEIDLTGSLNLNRFKADIKPYEGFNERNAPYYGGCLSPLYVKDDGTVGTNEQIYRGHRYSMTSGKVYKDGTVILDVSSSGSFSKTVIRDSNTLDYFGAFDYVEKAGNNIKVCIRGNSYTINDAEYDNSRFIVDYKNKGTFLIIGYRSSGTLYVKVYLYKWGGTWSSGLGLMESTPIAKPTLPSWVVSDSKIVYYIQGTSNVGVGLHFTYDGAPYYFYGSNSIQFQTYTSSGATFYHYGYVDSNDNVHEDAQYSYTHTFSNDHVTVTGHYEQNGTTVNFSDSYNSFADFAKSQYCYTMGVSCGYTDGLLVIVIKDHGYFQRPGSRPNRVNTCFLDFWGGCGLDNNYGIDLDDYLENDSEAGRVYANKIDIEGAQDYTKIFTYIEQRQNGLGYLSATSTLAVGSTHSRNNNRKLCYVGSSSRNVPGTLFGDRDKPVGAMPLISLTEAETFIPSGRQCYEVYNSHFRILGTNTGIVQGVSYINNMKTADERFSGQSVSYAPGDRGYIGDVGTLLCSWGAIDSSKNVYLGCSSGESGIIRYGEHVSYYDLDDEAWYSYGFANILDNKYTIIGDYIVVNTTDYYNSVNINTGKKYHWASDWNDRFTGFKNFESYNTFIYQDDYYDTVELASAQNPNWLSHYLSSAVFPPEIVSKYNKSNYTISGVNANTPDGNKVELYEDLKYLKNIDGSVNANLIGTIYPGGETRYNIPLFFTANNSLYNLITITFGSSSFIMMYYDNKPRYQYLASSIATFDSLFIIQGQAYGIYDGKIYSIDYAQNTIQNTKVIVPIEGLQFIGATIYNAYFYSPTSKAIYQFGADNNLVIFAQADTFDTITGAEYIPSTGSIIIGVIEGTSKYTYVLNERFGIYRIKQLGAVYDAGWMDDSSSILCFVRADGSNTNKAYLIAYEPIEGYTQKDIILDTSFYGAGSNVVSVNDCWYIRVTDPEHNAGEIKLAVSTLTDIGRQTETRTFPIKTKDWDELTDTVYIRFQPKLQRAVGVSLHIESPFKIGYIGVGATPETLQLNRGTI